MNTAIIVALIPYVVPSVLIVIGYLYHLLAQLLPAQQRAYIERWAAVAVAMVEQQFAGKSNEEKKALAMNEVKAFFRAFNLPVPPDDILSAFIEAAVNALPSTTTQPLTAILETTKEK